ncbi:MAG: hypothetical protein H0U27_01150, partial [Nitrosopumilus sp.]|nr:hypothetical protein [Nitrosopumilus sp.]
MKGDGYIVCGKTGCGERGFITRVFRKTKVQIPRRNKITLVSKALDYNAKVFYRLYEFLTLLPFDAELEKEFNITKYAKIVPFSPHNNGDIKSFEDRFTDLLSKKYDIFNKRNSSIHSDKINPKIEYNNNNIYKLNREIDMSQSLKNLSRPSLSCLFYSISFASLRDIYKEIEDFGSQDTDFQNVQNEMKSNSFIFSQCIMIPYCYIENILDKRYHIPVHKIQKFIRDSFDHGIRGASTKNSKNWLICVNCLGNGRKSLFINGKCPVCGNTKKRISRIDPKSIENIRYHVINDMLFYYRFYHTMLINMSDITDLIKNQSGLRESYLFNFKKYEIQVIDSESSYLKTHNYLLCHYNKERKSKKISHSLNELDILNTRIIDNDYFRVLWL